MVLAIFALIIILPLVWVLLLSVKSLPDAYQNDIWPKTFDFSHYGYSLAEDSDAAAELPEQHHGHPRHGGDHDGLRDAGGLRDGLPATCPG